MYKGVWNKVEQNVFTKQQFLQSKNLVYSKDVINAVLKENRLYSKKEAEKIIKMYYLKYMISNVLSNKNNGHIFIFCIYQNIL